MDISELTKIIINRIQKVEPDNVIKIIGCILLKEPSEQEMIHLAFGPESTLLSKITDSKSMLNIISTKSSPSSSQMQSMAYHQYASSLQSLNFALEDDYSLRNQTQFLSMDDQLDPPNQMSNYFYQDVGLGSRTNRRSPSLPEFPLKACHCFYKGYFQHGANCRYFHGLSFHDVYNSQIYSPNMNELGNEDNGFSPGSLEKFEMEITELLRSRRGMPVSIALLPMLYYEKYGRNLQAEAYLTESRKHGKDGFSLTKLLAWLRNSIRLIDRPHGQHSVILAEDAPRYMECRSERGDHGAVLASSHKIYLTFLAECIFTEEDVSNYFRHFGPVRDVRIPSQEKRMFGFVSFVYQETVNMILMKRNLHYICGARVLVKPYREKLRTIDRSYVERIKPSMYYPSNYLEMDAEINSMPREFESSNSLRKHLMEEQEKMLGLERRRLSELNLAKPNNQQSYFSLSEGPDEFPLMDHFSYTLDSLNNNSTNDDKARHTSNSCSDQESRIDLSESPFFASPPIGSSISAVN